MKISQDAKKRRKNISEYYLNGFDDGEGTKKKRLQQDKPMIWNGCQYFQLFKKYLSIFNHSCYKQVLKAELS